MIPQQAIDLILDAEGIDQPSKWPGEASGITLGYGYDLGYEKTFEADWQDILSSGSIARLHIALGVTGQNAHEMASRFRDITITSEMALKVFMAATLPHYEMETLIAFPGAQRLPALALGALVSLVFNRGTDMVGPRRIEMRAIRDAVSIRDLPQIAQQLRAMKRLWVGQGLDGLLVRRENEAKLVEAAIAEPTAPREAIA